jgi:hypothetical protein
MLNETIPRAAEPSERRYLADALRRAPTRMQRLRRGIVNGVLLCAASSLILVLAWAALAAVLQRVSHLNVGWHSSIALGISAVILIVAPTGSVFSTFRWMRGWKDIRPLLAADLESGIVVEEHYELAEARRFQEPEYGGLVYFLRSTDGRVLTLYDHESQSLGAHDEDPFMSTLQPKSHLVIVRAPNARFVLDLQFSGRLLDPGATLQLAIPSRLWPESEELCTIPWDALEARLSARRQIPQGR